METFPPRLRLLHLGNGDWGAGSSSPPHPQHLAAARPGGRGGACGGGACGGAGSGAGSPGPPCRLGPAPAWPAGCCPGRGVGGVEEAGTARLHHWVTRRRKVALRPPAWHFLPGTPLLSWIGHEGNRAKSCEPPLPRCRRLSRTGQGVRSPFLVVSSAVGGSGPRVPRTSAQTFCPRTVLASPAPRGEEERRPLSGTWRADLRFALEGFFYFRDYGKGESKGVLPCILQMGGRSRNWHGAPLGISQTRSVCRQGASTLEGGSQSFGPGVTR